MVTDTEMPILSQEEPLTPATAVESTLVLVNTTLALEKDSLVIVTGTFKFHNGRPVWSTRLLG